MTLLLIQIHILVRIEMRNMIIMAKNKGNDMVNVNVTVFFFLPHHYRVLTLQIVTPMANMKKSCLFYVGYLCAFVVKTYENERDFKIISLCAFGIQRYTDYFLKYNQVHIMFMYVLCKRNIRNSNISVYSRLTKCECTVML